MDSSTGSSSSTQPRSGIAGMFDRILLKRGIDRAFDRTFLALEQHLTAARVIPGDPAAYEAGFSQTETCLVLWLVNGSRFQPLQRSRSVIPASRAIRSSSEGHT